MTHRTVASLKDKWKYCSLKSLTAKHSGNKEHKVDRTRQSRGREEPPELGGQGRVAKDILGSFYFVLPWKRFYLSLTMKLQK